MEPNKGGDSVEARQKEKSGVWVEYEKESCGMSYLFKRSKM
jgi:hypothetical protein